MKPQSAVFLEKASSLLEQANTMLDVALNDAAGRTAYLADFHAAQALIFEVHDRVFKTHSGVRSEFARLVKDDLRVDGELRAFLGVAYDLKTIADYGTDPVVGVGAESARAALLTARRFVVVVTGLIPSGGEA